MDKKSIATNRKAFHDFHILDNYEAGVVLKGDEVKSVREGRVNLRDAFARVEHEELYLYHMHISPYSHARQEECDPLRTRKLLLHKKEIKRLMGRVQEKGLTLVPLELYFKRGRLKINLALAKGKNTYDKREELKRRAAERDIERAFRERNK